MHLGNGCSESDGSADDGPGIDGPAIGDTQAEERLEALRENFLKCPLNVAASLYIYLPKFCLTQYNIVGVPQNPLQ